MNIAENILRLKKDIPPKVKLVAVTKMKTANEILQAYEAGHKIFGENRVQELVEKTAALPDDIEWHMIGHLQSNKVKQVIPLVSMIQSVDSFNLLSIIDKEAEKQNRVIKCLLQIHIADEESKFGFTVEEAEEMLASRESRDIRNIRICGLMGIATFTDDTEKIRKEFSFLSRFFQKLKSGYFKSNEDFKELSMGMSDDYRIAIEEGSTIVRISSLIFGERYQIK